MLMIDFDLAVRRQQLEAHYQPIVELQNGAFVAIEARVRWSDGAQNHLTAGDVLQAAVAAQAHWTVDRAVLESAVAALDRLRNEAAPELQVAVNIAAATCTTAESAERLEAHLAGAAIKPQRLHLEFPLEAFRSAPSIVVPLVRRLAASHYGIVVDHVDSADFEAAHLDEVPVQGIKLSEHLVEQAPGDAASGERVRAICQEARKRDWHVGAEGMVRINQLHFLRQAGCEEAQGPLISRPRTLGELMFLLKKGSCW